MSMTRTKIEAAKTAAHALIRAADAALARLDKNVEHRKSWYHSRQNHTEEPKPSPEDYSFGSMETGTLRRESMNLTRTLADMRK